MQPIKSVAVIDSFNFLEASSPAKPLIKAPAIPAKKGLAPLVIKAPQIPARGNFSAVRNYINSPF